MGVSAFPLRIFARVILFHRVAQSENPKIHGDLLKYENQKTKFCEFLRLLWETFREFFSFTELHKEVTNINRSFIKLNFASLCVSFENLCESFLFHKVAQSKNAKIHGDLLKYENQKTKLCESLRFLWESLREFYSFTDLHKAKTQRHMEIY